MSKREKFAVHGFDPSVQDGQLENGGNKIVCKIHETSDCCFKVIFVNCEEEVASTAALITYKHVDKFQK